MPVREGVNRRRRLIVVLVLAAVVVYGVAGGCGVTHMPPGPSPEEAALLEEAPLPYTVVVVPWLSQPTDLPHPELLREPMAYAANLARTLAASGAFESVTLDTLGTAKADLIVISTGDYCSAAPLPFVTGLTLGIVPSIFQDGQCVGARFLSPDGDQATDSVVVRLRYAGTTVLGWVAVPMSLLPGWAHGDPKRHRRYRDLLTIEILKEREAIARLVER